MKVKILTLRITLRGSEPVIWRQLVVDSRMTLAKLHRVIQIAMGWGDCHHHLFFKGKDVFGALSDDLWGPIVLDERKVRLFELLPRKGSKMEYEYDFGDSWSHGIEVVATRAYDDQKHFPSMILDGACACPPEDIGGIHRYNEYVREVLPNPKHPEYESLREWLGEDFDPMHFHLDQVTQQLRGR